MNDASPLMREISIYDQVFPVRAPYQEGHVITAIEAKVLNQTRAENISNNFRKRVKAAQDGTPLKEGEAAPTMEQVAADLAKYDAEYTFAMPSVGREPIDPLERECYRIAKQVVKDAIAAQGKKLKDYTDEQLEAAYDKAAQKEDIVKEAKRRLNAQKKNAESALADLGL